MTRLEEIAARAERANPRCAWTYVAVNGTPMECGYSKSVPQMHEDHEFTQRPGWAADVPFLLAEVERLRAVEQAARSVMVSHRSGWWAMAEMDALEAALLAASPEIA